MNLCKSCCDWGTSRPLHLESTTRSADKAVIGAGYSTGEIRIFDYLNKTVKAVLRGHRAGITCMSTDGTNRLASGGRDCEIFLWDLLSMTALCRLHGHTDAVTGLSFLPAGPVLGLGSAQPNRLVSCSKDSLLKVWDTETQVCLQTITGHRCEIWSMALSPGGLLVTGAADELLRGYSYSATATAVPSSKTKASTATASASPSDEQCGADIDEVLSYIGAVARTAGGQDKCSGLHFSACGTLLAAQSSGKAIDIFRVRSEVELQKKLKRKAKRTREKDRERDNTTAAAESDVGAVTSESLESTPASGGELELTLADFLEVHPALRCSHKVRSFAFSPQVEGQAKRGAASGAVRAMVALADNVVEVYSLTAVDAASPKSQEIGPPVKTAVLELQGHRSDVRALSLSSDGLVLASCSADGVKVWSTTSYLCTRTCPAGYGVAIVFAPGDRYVLQGTRDGKIQAVDVSSGEMALELDAHTGPVWSLAVRPDGRGVMSGGADKLVRFWDFSVAGGKLGLVLNRELAMSADVLSVRYSSTKSEAKLLVAVALLDHTVKIFFDDSLKFYLSLYGHKLPVMCLDVSSDSTLLASGSADKTVKLWGLDFGDCHRSLLGHEDSITALRWQPQTHLLFSCSKDGVVKYWDADRFEQILHLPGHLGPVWCLDVSYDCALVITGGADRSLRVWERTEDQVFVSEEKERYLEAQAEKALEAQGKGADGGSADGAVATATLRSMESIKGAERLIDVLEDLSRDDGGAGAGAGLEAVRKCLRNIAAPDVEAALLELPMHLVGMLLDVLVQLSRSGPDVELSARSALFLLRLHISQIQMSSSLRSQVEALSLDLRAGLGSLRTLLGTNRAGLRLMERAARERQLDRIGDGSSGSGLVSSAGTGDLGKGLGKRSKHKGKKRKLES